MGPIFELMLTTSALVLLFILLFVPIGALLAARVIPNVSARLRVLSSFGFSIFFYVAVTLLALHYSIPKQYISWMLIVIASLAFSFWAASGMWRECISKELFYGFSLCLLYSILCNLSAAFPAGDMQDVRVETTMLYTGLPVDNLIPYNFSRYVVEGINPNSLEIVPDWQATDRGPLGGLVTAVVFVLLRIEENGYWLSTSPGLFFVYQTLLTFLNLLSLLAVWVVGCELGGRRVGAYAALALGSSYFYFMNVLFSWPKFLMGYFVLVALCLWWRGRHWALAGVFFGGGMLSHDSAIFNVAAFIPVAVLLLLCSPEIQSFRRRVRTVVPALAVFFGAFVLITSPWLVYKKFFGEQSPRLLYLHLFCFNEQNIVSLTFNQALERYLEAHSALDIALIKWQNLIYSFNLGPAWTALRATWPDVFTFFLSIADYVFFQVVLGVGLIIFIIALLALGAALRNKASRVLVWFFLISFGAVIFVALISGCAGNAVNHIWAYPAFLVTALACGWVVARSGVWLHSLFALGVIANILMAMVYFSYRPALKPFLHATDAYGYMQLLLIMLCIALIGKASLMEKPAQAKQG